MFDNLIPAATLSDMSRFLGQSVWKFVFLLTLLAAGGRCADSNCTNRRCLAEMLINKNYSSQPQYENCTHSVHMPFIEYQTLSVSTKELRLITRLQAIIVWRDPELEWDTSIYKYDKVVLPVDKIWTPEVHVTNGIITTMKHSSHDLLVYSNGTVRHMVIINAEVNCEVNLFNYPFAADECPVAIQTWSADGCGTELEMGYLKMVDGTHGDWQTTNVVLQRKRNDRNYIMVTLSIKFVSPFLTLMLPSFLIILADLVSFALPLEGGERNSFKVTLVLSFTMFLIILNNMLPGDSDCSPIIRPHFCICLCLLVLSMLVSMVLTRVAKDGGFIFSCVSKGSIHGRTGDKEEEENEEAKADVSVVQLNASESQPLKKVVNFLERLDARELECERCQKFANKMDKICFWCYLVFCVLYFCVMMSFMLLHECDVDHFDFWY